MVTSAWPWVMDQSLITLAERNHAQRVEDSGASPKAARRLKSKRAKHRVVINRSVAAPNGSRLSCGRLACRRKSGGRQSGGRQRANTRLPLKRSPPASFKRLLGARSMNPLLMEVWRVTCAGSVLKLLALLYVACPVLLCLFGRMVVHLCFRVELPEAFFCRDAEIQRCRAECLGQIHRCRIIAILTEQG